jgi:hypothetical protein
MRSLHKDELFEQSVKHTDRLSQGLFDESSERLQVPPKYSLIDVTNTMINRSSENPERKEIIRKIRNFNDFINAVKKEFSEKKDR